MSATNLSDGGRLPGREGMTTPAAVLVPLVNRSEGLTVLFTERSADLPIIRDRSAFPAAASSPRTPTRSLPRCAKPKKRSPCRAIACSLSGAWPTTKP